MVRYLGPIVAVSLLALAGCLTYPYGSGYYGYEGYGEYPSYGYPYNYPQYGAPYCSPSYGYSCDPYASQYGYGYGCDYAPGVAVPAPAPPVVVENPPPYEVDNPWYPSGDAADARRRRHLAREGWRNRYPNSGDSQSDPTRPFVTGDGSLTPGDRQQTAGDWRRQRFGNRFPPADNSGTPSGTFDPARRLRSGSRSPAPGDLGQGTGTWQTGRTREPFTSRGMPTQPQMRSAPYTHSNAGPAPVSPQMRQSPMPRQQSGPAGAPQMRTSPSPSPRPMMAGTPRTFNRPQVSQARPQVSGQSRGAVREARQRPQ